MSASDLERLVSDAKKNKQLVGHFALLGHDTGAFTTVANRLGYKVTEDDVNTYLAKKTAAIIKHKTGHSTAAGSTVTSTVQVAVGVTAVTVGTDVAVLVEAAVVLT
jgi:hypothetical protein